MLIEQYTNSAGDKRSMYTIDSTEGIQLTNTYNINTDNYTLIGLRTDGILSLHMNSNNDICVTINKRFSAYGMHVGKVIEKIDTTTNNSWYEVYYMYDGTNFAFTGLLPNNAEIMGVGFELAKDLKPKQISKFDIFYYTSDSNLLQGSTIEYGKVLSTKEYVFAEGFGDLKISKAFLLEHNIRMDVFHQSVCRECD